MAPTRLPPPTGRPPMYAFAGRAFGRTNLRPVVIVFTIMASVWSIIWAAGAFDDVNGDKQNSELKKLVIFDIVLGALYAAVAAIELFGLGAAVTRRPALARLFSLLSVLVIFLVGGAELIRTIAHFVFKGPILDECVQESTGKRVRTSFGFWGGVTRTLDQQDAQDFCNHAYSRGGFSVIAWFLVATLVSVLFASTAYAFYLQLLDPMSSRSRAPSDQVRLQNINQTAYGRSYNYDEPPQGYGGGYIPYPSFAPPPGPPPPANYAPPYEGSKLPGYGADGGTKEVNDDKEDPFKDGSSKLVPDDDPFRDNSRHV